MPPGEYQVQICQTPNTMGVPQMAPFNYAGTFTYDDTVVPGGGVPYPPKWKYFKANPPLDYSTNDTRRIGCWEAAVLGIPVAGCEVSELNTASRAPWDYIFRTGTFTATTRGNNAQTAESWGSPLTPSTPYRPTSATREYIYPWVNNWKTSGAMGKGMRSDGPGSHRRRDAGCRHRRSHRSTFRNAQSLPRFLLLPWLHRAELKHAVRQPRQHPGE